MTLDPYERRTLFQVALVSAMLAGALVAALAILTSLSPLVIAGAAVVAFGLAFAGMVLFAAS
jgi:hypothetical protein